MCRVGRSRLADIALGLARYSIKAISRQTNQETANVRFAPIADIPAVFAHSSLCRCFGGPDLKVLL
jgi:hypothetical protein